MSDVTGVPGGAGGSRGAGDGHPRGGVADAPAAGAPEASVGAAAAVTLPGRRHVTVARSYQPDAGVMRQAVRAALGMVAAVRAARAEAARNENGQEAEPERTPTLAA